MRRARILLISAAIGGAIAVLVSGCRRESSAPTPAVTAATDEPAAANPPPTDEASTPAVASRAEKPGLPSDVPLYSPATPISSMSSPTRGTIVDLRSQDAVELVARWYDGELPARGWRLETQSGQADSHLVTALKDVRKATVLITGGPDGTEILLTVLENR